MIRNAPEKETLSLGSSVQDECEEAAFSDGTFEKAQIQEAPDEETASLGSTSEGEDGAVSHIISVRAMIHNAPEKETLSLGVSAAGTAAFWRAACGLWSLLQE
ncbi:uncharacterized protein AAGF69_016126 [Amazona ochrocephala]